MSNEEFETAYPHFLGSEIEQGAPEHAFFQVLPAPHEASVSYGGGTRFGPSEILKASWQLEMWDNHSRPCDLGIYTAPVVDCSDSEEQSLENIRQATLAILKRGQFPVVIGGEHSVTGAVIQAYIDAGHRDFGVVQIDAHADLRHAYEDNLLSHASVMKRVVEHNIPLVQLGIRAYCEEEMQARDDFNVVYHDANELVPNNIQSIELPEDFPEKVFFTLDIDGMDPSVFPSTGTPVPGGLGWYQTLNLFKSVVKQRQIIGFDLMEFAPIKGFHAYEFAAAQLIYKMMGIVQRHRK
ncbi:agmatinase [Agaribacterium sp. ZY112]|uniref:agmatinase n=1 Tax=Agaribacterium sp. ZY112 TaxID=3233574 RepID=UPI003524807F